MRIAPCIIVLCFVIFKNLINECCNKCHSLQFFFQNDISNLKQMEWSRSKIQKLDSTTSIYQSSCTGQAEQWLECGSDMLPLFHLVFCNSRQGIPSVWGIRILQFTDIDIARWLFSGTGNWFGGIYARWFCFNKTYAWQLTTSVSHNQEKWGFLHDCVNIYISNRLQVLHCQ